MKKNAQEFSNVSAQTTLFDTGLDKLETTIQKVSSGSLNDLVKRTQSLASRQQQIRIEFDKSNQSIIDTTGQLNLLSNEVEQLSDNSFNGLIRQTQSLADRQRTLTSSLKSSSDQLDILEQTVVATSGQLNLLSGETDDLSKAQKRSIGELRKFNPLMRSHRDIVKDTSTQLSIFSSVLTNTNATVTRSRNIFSRLDDAIVGTRQGINKLTQSLGTLQQLIPLASGVLLADRLRQIGSEAFQAQVELGRLNEQSGVSITTLDLFRRAAFQFGFDMGEVSGLIETFVERIQEAAEETGEGAEVFDKLGINVRDASGNIKDAETVLQEYTQAVTELGDQQEAAAINTQLLSADGFRLGGAFDELSQRIGEANEELDANVQNALDADKAWRDFQLTLQDVSNNLVNITIPYFEDLLTVSKALLDTLSQLSKVELPGGINVGEELLNRFLPGFDVIGSIGNAINLSRSGGGEGLSDLENIDRQINGVTNQLNNLVDLIDQLRDSGEDETFIDGMLVRMNELRNELETLYTRREQLEADARRANMESSALSKEELAEQQRLLDEYYTRLLGGAADATREQQIAAGVQREINQLKRDEIPITDEILAKITEIVTKNVDARNANKDNNRELEETLRLTQEITDALNEQQGVEGPISNEQHLQNLRDLGNIIDELNEDQAAFIQSVIDKNTENGEISREGAARALEAAQAILEVEEERTREAENLKRIAQDVADDRAELEQELAELIDDLATEQQKEFIRQIIERHELAGTLDNDTFRRAIEAAKAIGEEHRKQLLETKQLNDQYLREQEEAERERLRREREAQREQERRDREAQREADRRERERIAKVREQLREIDRQIREVQKGPEIGPISSSEIRTISRGSSTNFQQNVNVTFNVEVNNGVYDRIDQRGGGNGQFDFQSIKGPVVEVLLEELQDGGVLAEPARFLG